MPVALSQVKGIDPVAVFVVNFIAIMYDPVDYETRSQLIVQSSCGHAELRHRRSGYAVCPICLSGKFPLTFIAPERLLVVF